MRVIVVHGGAGGTSSVSREGCQQAARVGMEVLQRKVGALKGVVAPVEWMENSGLFNAGTGSILRYHQGDEEIMQMDAVVAATSIEKIYGAVSGLTGIKNPILLALAVLTQTDHLIVTGEGALKLAQDLKLDIHPGPTQVARRRLARIKREILEGRIAAPDLNLKAFRRMLRELREDASSGFVHASVPKECDTVGAIALDENGTIALASSTGGSSVMLLGRVGDVPVRNSGWQIGEYGAVLSTGYGEEILKREGAGRVYAFIVQGLNPKRACEQVAGEFPNDIPVGFIALNKKGSIGIGANCPMDTHFIVE